MNSRHFARTLAAGAISVGLFGGCVGPVTEPTSVSAPSASVSAATTGPTPAVQTPTPAAPTPSASTASNPAPYGVFIGLDPEGAKLLHNYGTVVIDAAYFTKAELAPLKQQGIKIYSYLNIGSIEDFREGYAKFKKQSLGKYEDWPGEYWMDVSQPAWQAYIDKSAQALVDKGVDGFFLDNTDVYYQYPRKTIFDGLVKIINNLAKSGKDVLINGGDVFVTKAVLKPPQPLVKILGVNQECLFTGIDFDHNKFVTQNAEDHKYYEAYLNQVRAAGFAVFLTEYADKNQTALRKKINDYCDSKGYACFISTSLNLDR